MKFLLSFCLIFIFNAAIVDAKNDPHRQFVINVMQKFTAPQVQDLATDSHDFHKQVVSYCTSSSLATIDVLHNSFINLVLTWKAHLSNQWGPTAKSRLERNIDFWPTRVNNLKTLLSAQNITAAFNKSGVAVKGLPAVEWLLFGNKASQKHTNFCPLLQLLSNDIALRTQQVVDQWEEMSTALKTSDTNDDKLFIHVYSPILMEEYINAMTVFIYQTRKRALITPLGLRTGGIKPQRTENILSNLSTPVLVERISALKNLLSHPQYGLISFLQQQQLDSAIQLQTHLDKVLSHMKLIDQPIDQLLEQNKTVLVELEQKLNDLQYQLEYDVAQDLNIVMYFRDMDGD